MCVIAYCKERKLTWDEFENCYDTNDDGVGISYRKNGKVHYVKGIMELKEAWEIYNKLRIRGEHVVHFRVGTSGSKGPELTHPFIVSRKSPLRIKYSGNKEVLFHNGVISDWEEWTMPYYISQKFLPEGEMSDTRLAAMLVSQLGEKVLDVIKGKYVIFGSKRVYVRGEFEEVKGVMFSNTSYKGYKTYSYAGSTYEYGYGRRKSRGGWRNEKSEKSYDNNHSYKGYSLI